LIKAISRKTTFTENNQMSRTRSRPVSPCLDSYIIPSCNVPIFWRTLVDQHEADHHWHLQCRDEPFFGPLSARCAMISPSNSANAFIPHGQTVSHCYYTRRLCCTRLDHCVLSTCYCEDHLVYHEAFMPLFLDVINLGY
jgi:hypothetical protein